MSYKTINYDGRIKTVFNGILYLSKDLFYSEQFLGSGETASESEDNMRKTIKKHNLKADAYLIGKYGVD